MSEHYVVELSGLPYLWGNLVKPCSFPIFSFSENVVEFCLRERSYFISQRLKWAGLRMKNEESKNFIWKKQKISLQKYKYRDLCVWTWGNLLRRGGML